MDAEQFEVYEFTHEEIRDIQRLVLEQKQRNDVTKSFLKNMHPYCRKYYDEDSLKIIHHSMSHTLDCYEYIYDKEINKFEEAYKLKNIER